MRTRWMTSSRTCSSRKRWTPSGPRTGASVVPSMRRIVAALTPRRRAASLRFRSLPAAGVAAVAAEPGLSLSRAPSSEWADSLGSSLIGLPLPARERVSRQGSLLTATAYAFELWAAWPSMLRGIASRREASPVGVGDRDQLAGQIPLLAPAPGGLLKDPGVH